METEPTFNSDTETIAYWRQLAIERRADFDELQDMNEDYEREMEVQIERLETEKKTAAIQNARLIKELDEFRDRQREKDTEREDELEIIKGQLETESTQRLDLTKLNRQLEQDIDDLERRYRTLHVTFEQNKELLDIESERNAILETDVCEKTNLQELVQRLRDEKRDLTSEIEVRDKLQKRDTPKNQKEIKNEPTPSGLENRVVGEGGVASVLKGVVKSPLTPSSPHPHPSPSPSLSSIQSNSSSQSRLSALSIVGDLLRKVGALETKLASCRTFVRDNSSTIPNPSPVSTTPRRSSLNRDSEPRSPMRTPGGIYSSPLRTSHSATFSTPNSRRAGTATPAKGQANHDTRIGERLANQRALFSNGSANGVSPGDRLQNPKTIKLNAP